MLLELLGEARRQGVESVEAYYQLAWVLSGKEGSPPQQLDRVYSEGGYAALRSSWTSASAIVAHFTCSRHSRVHYPQDETSFELYGYGQELIVDSGLYSYRDDALSTYQKLPHAHNVLVIDGRAFEPLGRPSILAHRTCSDLAWVQGSHSNYESLEIDYQARTFAHAKPASFVIVDHVRDDAGHAFSQLFHLHPSLVAAKLDEQSVLATSSIEEGPSILLRSDLMFQYAADGAWQSASWSVGDDERAIGIPRPR